MTWRTYLFMRIRNGVEEIGLVSGNTPEEAMFRCNGSHPESYGITYAIVYLPGNEDIDSDYTREWGTYIEPGGNKVGLE